MRKVHVAEALHYLSLHKTVSIPELHAYLQTKFDDYSITQGQGHFLRVIRDNNFTRKRTRHGHYPKIRHIQPRHEYHRKRMWRSNREDQATPLCELCQVLI